MIVTIEAAKEEVKLALAKVRESMAELTRRVKEGLVLTLVDGLQRVSRDQREVESAVPKRYP